MRVQAAIASWLLLLLAVAVVCVSGRGVGAPYGSCDTMAPQHRNAAGPIAPLNVRSRHGFSIMHDMCRGYQASTHYTVRIRGPRFRGFFCRVQEAGSFLQRKAHGKWDGRTLPFYTRLSSCNKPSTGVTHSKLPSGYTDLTFGWTSPAVNKGPLQITCTMAETFERFYVGIRSQEVCFNPSRGGSPCPETSVHRGDLGCTATVQTQAAPAGPPGQCPATCPAGPTGRKGSAGSAGIRGPSGARGPPGVPGPSGYQGRTGQRGSPGPAGQGSQGRRGDQGTRGPAGVKGSAGPKGNQGSRGSDGGRGRDGRAGPPGPPGPAVSGVFASTRNAAPPRSIPAEQGPAGPPGPTGPRGARGAPGRGSKGNRGLDGFDGENGRDGLGLRGPPGPPGPPGDRAASGTGTGSISSTDIQALKDEIAELRSLMNVGNGDMTTMKTEMGTMRDGLSILKADLAARTPFIRTRTYILLLSRMSQVYNEMFQVKREMRNFQRRHANTPGASG